MATIDYWVANLKEKCKSVLDTYSKENLDALKIWMSKIDNFASEFNLFDVLKKISKDNESSSIYFALKAVDLNFEAESLWKLSGSAYSESINTESAYYLMTKLKIGVLAKVQILKKFAGEKTEQLRNSIATEVGKFLDENHSISDDQLRVIYNYAHYSKNVNFLLQTINFYDLGDWRKRLRHYLINREGSIEEVFKACANTFSRAVLDNAKLEIDSREGNTIALEAFLNQEKKTREKSCQLFDITKSEKIDTCLACFTSGGISESSAKFVLQTNINLIEISHLEKFYEKDITDLEFRSLLIQSYSNFDKYLWIYEKLKDCKKNELSDVELVCLAKAAIRVKDFNLIFDLIHLVKIEREEIAILSAELINVGRWEDSEKVLSTTLKNFSQKDVKDILKIRNNLLDGPGLVVLFENTDVEWGLGFFKLANYLWNSTSNYPKVYQVLNRGIKLGSYECAQMLIDISQELELNEEIFQLAAGPWQAHKYKREYAKYLIKRDRLLEATELAEDAAQDDDQAAHLLIHVLGHNVNRWAEFLSNKNSVYTSEVYKDEFISFGLPMLQSSELETKHLHNLEEMESLGYSRKRVASGEEIIEKWICNEAFSSNDDESSWFQSACGVHREDLYEFENLGLIPKFNDPVWESQKQLFKQNSAALDIENHPQLLQAFKSRYLRKWQIEAYEKWIRHGRTGIIEAATGSGKSMIGVFAALEALDEGLAVVIVTPTRVLQQQWISQYFRELWVKRNSPLRTLGNKGARFERQSFGISPGTITFAVVDSLRSHSELFPRSDKGALIIADEVHNYSSKFSRTIFSENYSRRLGLTATLQPPPGRYGVLTNYFGGHPIFTYSFRSAVQDDVISNYNLLIIRVPLNQKNLSDYTIAYEQMINLKNQLVKLAEIPADTETFEKDILKLKSRNKFVPVIKAYEEAFEKSDQLLRESESKAEAVRLLTGYVKRKGNTIIFSDSNNNARNIIKIFENRGVSSKLVNAYVPQSDREIIFNQLRKGSVQAILSPRALDEGIDIAELSTGIFSGTSRRRLQIIQRMGRVLRKSEGKEIPLIIMIASSGTEEDPYMPSNSSLEKSPYGIVFDQALNVHIAEVSDEASINHILEVL